MAQTTSIDVSDSDMISSLQVLRLGAAEKRGTGS